MFFGDSSSFNSSCISASKSLSSESLSLTISSTVILSDGVGLIFVCGLAFKGKPETGDVRNSSAVEIYHLLKYETKNILGHDPIASAQEIKDVGVTSVEFQEGIKNSDVVLFLNNNEYYEKLDMYDVVRKMGKNPIIVDGWKIFRAEDILNARPCLYMDLSQIKKSVI